MSFSTSQLQQIRALVSTRIAELEQNRDSCIHEADKAEADLNIGKYPPECIELVLRARTALWNTSKTLDIKIQKLDSLRKTTKKELVNSYKSGDNQEHAYVFFDFESITDRSLGNMFVDPSLLFSTAILADMVNNND